MIRTAKYSTRDLDQSSHINAVLLTPCFKAENERLGMLVRLASAATAVTWQNPIYVGLCACSRE